MDMNTFSDKDLKFKLPFGLIISRASSSGKSTFLTKFIAEVDNLVVPKPASILYCFGEMSNICLYSKNPVLMSTLVYHQRN